MVAEVIQSPQKLSEQDNQRWPSGELRLSWKLVEFAFQHDVIFTLMPGTRKDTSFVERRVLK